MKNKFTTAILALFFGMMGAHRFYLGQQKYGIFYFAIFMVLFGISVSADMPFIMPILLLGFLDAVIFAFMPKDDFDAKYNPQYKEPMEFMDRNVVYDEMENEAPKALHSGEPLADQLDLKRLNQIEHYGKLLDQGYITKQEFERIKQKLL